MENLKKKTFIALLWEFGGKFAEQSVGFFISIILARLLLPEEFGLLAMITVVVSLAQVFIDSGLEVSLVQRKDVTDAHYGSVFFFNITVGAFLTIVFFLLSGLIAKFYAKPELKMIMQVLSFSFIINSFARIRTVYLIKQLKFNVIARTRITSVLISGGVGVLLAFCNYGVWALVVQSLLAGIVSCLYLVIAVKWNPRFIFSWDALRDLWGFGFRMFLSGMLNTVVSHVDNLIIGKVFAPATLGYYHRAKSLNQFIVKYTSGSLMPVLFPALTSIQDDNERFLKVVTKGFHVLCFITFLLLGVIYINAENIVVILFTKKWLVSVVYFKIILLSSFVYPLSALLVNILSAKGNSKAFMYSGFIKQGMFILNLIFGFLFGLEGYLYGFVIVSIIALAVNFYFASREIGKQISFFFKMILPYLTITIFISGSLVLTNRIFIINNNYYHLLFFSLVYIIAYFIFAMIFKLKGLDNLLKEISNFKNGKKI